MKTTPEQRAEMRERARVLWQTFSDFEVNQLLDDIDTLTETARLLGEALVGLEHHRSDGHCPICMRCEHGEGLVLHRDGCPLAAALAAWRKP